MTRLIDANALLKQLKTLSFPIELDSNVMIIFVHDVVSAITNAPTVQREGWVSVEDRLPEFMLYAGEPLKVNGQDIPPLFRSERIMYVVEGVIFLGKLDKLNSTIIPSGVTYWQPLPAAPTDKE